MNEFFKNTLTILLLTLSQVDVFAVTSITGKAFIVERWHIDNCGGKGKMKEITERRYYSKTNKLIAFVGFSCGNIANDSVVFFYNEKNLLTEWIEYIPIEENGIRKYSIENTNSTKYFYDENGKQIDYKIEENSVLHYNKIYLEINLQNSLQLLDKELKYVEIVTDNVKVPPIRTTNQNIIKQAYKADFSINEVAWYGVPNNTILKKMNIYYTKEKRQLIKDEFFFERNILLTRNYKYVDGQIKEIRIEAQFKELKEVDITLEGFDYK